MIKILVAGERIPGISVAEMQRHALEVHAKLVQDCPGFWRRCRRYVQNHVFAQLDFETLEPIPDAQTKYDIFGEFWFDSLEDAKAAWRSDDYLRMLKPDEDKITRADVKFLMLCANEHVIGGTEPE
jgi:uncharacterized protein (TIGR02118 family)